MKKKYCYYGAFLLPAFVCWLAGCTDEFLPSPAVQTELKEFALEEAQEYFRSEAEKNIMLTVATSAKTCRVTAISFATVS